MVRVWIQHLIKKKRELWVASEVIGVKKLKKKKTAHDKQICFVVFKEERCFTKSKNFSINKS